LSQLPCPEWKNEQEPSDKLETIVKAAESIYDFIRRQNQKGLPLNHGHLKGWHAKLFKDVVPVPYYAGNYRSTDQRYPCLNTPIQVAGLPGAPPGEVLSRMTTFSAVLEQQTIDVDNFAEGQKNPELKLKAAAQLASFAAGHIIAIHPFINGNGRTARLTADFFFNRYGFRMPFFIDRPRGHGINVEYGSASRSAMQNDFKPLFRYFVVLMAS
jgi:fido (protein-threonine AMPylation protein)